MGLNLSQNPTPVPGKSFKVSISWREDGRKCRAVWRKGTEAALGSRLESRCPIHHPEWTSSALWQCWSLCAIDSRVRAFMEWTQ